MNAEPWIKENEILDCTGWGINNLATPESLSFSMGWFIANKILRNASGGIRCENSSPTISNNIIDNNVNFGIFLTGIIGKPAEPTIDDNVIGHTSYNGGGKGIYLIGYAEPRIIANDIYLNECGIWIEPNTQPSIIGNNINYNYEAGIRCYSLGSSKRVAITSNHIHSNTGPLGNQPAGIWILNCDPIISHNDISQNRRSGSISPDIDYSLSGFLPAPTISLNIFDNINTSLAAPAVGLYNTTSGGGMISP